MFEFIKKSLEKAFPNAKIIDIEDTNGDNYHFAITVVDDCFQDLNLVARHKMVMKAIGNKVGNEIHALSINALSEEEEEKNGS